MRSQVLLFDAMTSDRLEATKRALYDVGLQLSFAKQGCKGSVGVCAIVKDPSTGKVTLKVMHCESSELKL